MKATATPANDRAGSAGRPRADAVPGGLTLCAVANMMLSTVRILPLNGSIPAVLSPCPGSTHTLGSKNSGPSTQDSVFTVSSQPTSPTRRRASKQEESADSYPNIPEPRQRHAGNALAMLSVFAILAFGIWTALGTIAGSADKPATKPQIVPTSAPTAVPAAAPAPTATVSASPSPAAGATAASAPAKAATPGPGGTRVHVVGAGDTLYRIAQLYGTTVEAIMAANNFKDRSQVLHVGDKLNIP